MTLLWTCKKFKEISGGEMHEVLAARQRVFIVEQQCVYQDADEWDKSAWHLMGRRITGDLVAYGRVNFPGSRYPEPSLGRIFTARDVRRSGAGREVVQRCLTLCRRYYPERNVRISAQTYLIKFYGDFGFQTIGKPYDDEGIEHIDMILNVKATA